MTQDLVLILLPLQGLQPEGSFQDCVDFLFFTRTVKMIMFNKNLLLVFGSVTNVCLHR